ncbi:MAG: Cof-type HAD-IIB family hydrolase [Halanaerobiales bacterium]|nr:Cof-type HAD-IIB family hydrolase [Halanaerobiales bacterium]
MDVKMIVFDLDGTLLDAEHQLQKKTIEAVKMIRKKGIRTLVATGRMYCSAKPHTDQLEIVDPIITYNGALVVDPQNQQQIFHAPIPLEIAKKITKMVVKNDYHLQLYIDDQLYVAEENKFTDRYEEISGIKANAVGNLDQFLSAEPTKMLIIEEDKDKQLEINHFLENNFENEIELSSSYPSFIEITKKNMSKAVPIKKLAADFDIKPEEIMIFGDGLNDLTMIKWAGKGIAMQNAHPELQEQADEMAPNHDDLGIARYLKKHFNLDLDLDN